MMKYSYDEVIHIIENTRRFGNLTGVEVSKQMLEQLGNPQSGIPFVHVAGTNGKGSTTAFLCKILERAGKKVGMFTSPHLITFEERIRINGVYIPQEDVTRLGNMLLEMQFEVSPTMFDYCLAMAVLYFKEQSCDIIVMETGIGGRYDSTNALGVPELAIITKIGFDHMAVLGNTLEEIAGEKAGIIKAGAPVVVSTQQTQVIDVLLENFKLVNQENNFPKVIHTKQGCEGNVGILDAIDGVGFYETSQEDFKFVRSIPMKMLTGYQIENAATAMLAAKVLFTKWQKRGEVQVSDSMVEDYIKAGIAETFWKGRMEIVNEQPFFMIDGAHNSHGVIALANSLKELYPGEKFHFIMGVMADKDYEEMIDALLPLAIDFVTVTPESSRALQSKDLAECIQKKGIEARYVENMEEVIRPLLPVKACTVDRKEGDADFTEVPSVGNKTVAFGSLYFVGAIEAMLEKNNR
ncbi:MAG: bifunctional folylpolyglutamate synthase/dihydrofolate synthase [Agathobacter sp.]|nr:bifunctional folylpolyglutamate synthase/dihydrofolate synthase [Agathobacter sp.]